MDKIVRLGTVQLYRPADVFCHIMISNRTKGRAVSITGVEGPMRDGNCIGGCGQIVMSLKAEEIDPAPGWTTEKIASFLRVWDRWHLNDMRAGTPAQMEWLREHKQEWEEAKVNNRHIDHYTWACDGLREAGLNPDNGYFYGSAWLYEPLPDEVVLFLESLPVTDKIPAWI